MVLDCHSGMVKLFDGRQLEVMKGDWPALRLKDTGVSNLVVGTNCDGFLTLVARIGLNFVSLLFPCCLRVL